MRQDASPDLRQDNKTTRETRPIRHKHIQHGRRHNSSPYTKLCGCYPTSISRRQQPLLDRSPADDDERQLLAANFCTLEERALTHARQQLSMSFDRGNYVTLWVARERPNKHKPYVDLRRARDKVSDSVYILETP